MLKTSQGPPAFHTERVLLSPLLYKLERVLLRLLQCHGGVDLLQICGHMLDLLPADEAGGG